MYVWIEAVFSNTRPHKDCGMNDVSTCEFTTLVTRHAFFQLGCKSLSMRAAISVDCLSVRLSFCVTHRMKVANQCVTTSNAEV